MVNFAPPLEPPRDGSVAALIPGATVDDERETPSETDRDLQTLVDELTHDEGDRASTVFQGLHEDLKPRRDLSLPESASPSRGPASGVFIGYLRKKPIYPFARRIGSTRVEIQA